MGDVLGILIPEIPQQTHVFFWREIVALRELGVDVALLSTRRPNPAACRHEFAAAARAEAHYVYPPRPVPAAKWLASRPLQSLSVAQYVAGLRQSSSKAKAKVLALSACALDLAAHAQQRGIRHVHAHSCADAAHVVAMAERLGGPSYSLTLHGDLPVYGTDHESKVAHAACMSCAGPHLKTQLVEEVGYPADKILPNWMGLDTSRFARREPLSRRAGPVRLVTVARLNRTKGHVHALRAMKTALEAGADLTYSIAGEGPYRAEIEAEVAKLGLGERVRLLGTQAESQVLELMLTHDVFVLPSIGFGEAGPVSLMEAMSASLPCVVSIIGSTPHMVEDGVSAFLVEQGDEAALAKHLLALEDPELRARVGEAARRRAIAEFDVKSTARRLVEFIEAHTPHRFL